MVDIHQQDTGMQQLGNWEAPIPRGKDHPRTVSGISKKSLSGPKGITCHQKEQGKTEDTEEGQGEVDIT